MEKTLLEQQKICSPALIDQVQEDALHLQRVMHELQRVIVGNQNVIEMLLVSLLCKGHALLEGLPGVAKTTMIKAFAATLGLDCKRIQFTPDLLPSDLVGTLVYNQKTAEFETKFGPVFAHLIIADEINRAPAKVQSALLEVMQEQQVTIGNATYRLEPPFFVFATQNPLEQEGTYPLPEAQVDRFLCKLIVSYPTLEEEKAILFMPRSTESIRQVISRDLLLRLQELAAQVYVDERVVDYMLQLIFTLRNPREHKFTAHEKHISYAPSPRATISLYQAARARALVHRRHFVTPDDVKAVAPSVLRHRIMVSFEADAAGVGVETIIEALFKHIRTP